MQNLFYFPGPLPGQNVLVKEEKYFFREKLVSMLGSTPNQNVVIYQDLVNHMCSA